MVRTSRKAIAFGSVALGILTGVAARPGFAQVDDLPQAVRDYLDGCLALDEDRSTRTCAADGRREDITSPAVFQGHGEILQSLVDFFAAFEKAEVEHPAILAGRGALAADIWVFRGEVIGTRPDLPDGTGQRLTIRGFKLI